MYLNGPMPLTEMSNRLDRADPGRRRHPYVVAGAWRVHHPATAHVDRDVARTRRAEVEDQVADLRGADSRPVLHLRGGLVRQAHADRTPRRHGQSGAVIGAGPGVAPAVRLADLATGELSGAVPLGDRAGRGGDRALAARLEYRHVRGELRAGN